MVYSNPMWTYAGCLKSKPSIAGSYFGFAWVSCNANGIFTLVSCHNADPGPTGPLIGLNRRNHLKY